MRPARWIVIVVAFALLLQAAGSRSLMLCACDAMVEITSTDHDCCGAEHDQDPAPATIPDDHDCYDLQFGLDDTLRGDLAAFDGVAIIAEVRAFPPLHLTAQHARSTPLLSRPPPRRSATLDMLAPIRLLI